MSTSPRRRPAPRRRVLAATVALLALLGAVIATGELLRHPHDPISGIPEEELAGADPRDELLCPEPAPREGQQRDLDDEPSAPVQVDSNDLYDCPESFDGRRVVYRGEVVGALMDRRDGVWTQLNDDVYAELLGPLPAHRDYRGGNAGVGVLLPHDAAARVNSVGGPQTRGDVLEVNGIFHRVDATGEVAVIRADDAQLVAEGQPFPDPPLTDRRIAAWLAVLVAVGLTITERVVAARR
ncbi:MAG TPA: hypothetical protein VFZ70_13205 [Euzebyales bacterium]